MTSAAKSKPVQAEAKSKASQSSLKQNLLLMAGSLAFSVLVAEIVCRVYLFGAMSLLPDYGNSIHPLGVSKLVKPSENPRICYELRPGIDTIFKMVPFRTNSIGIVDKEYTLEKPAGTYRVICVGDSYTMPEGVKQEDAWHTVLEDEYTRQSGGRTYEFINFGVAGYTLDQELSTLEFRGLQYAPDHVILGFCVASDVPRTDDKPLPFPYKVKPTQYPYFHSHIWTMIDRALPKKTDWSAAKFDRVALKNKLSRFKELGQQHGFNVTVVALRRANEHEFEMGLLKEGAAAAGLPLIDAGVNFPDAGRKYWAFENNRHPNALANRIFADTIKKSLRLD